ncbi:hypothetical protein KSS87_012028 [Heliosperma pusillum]|nr:hypothetical protein KSS87_012028 [Heliosperma pusillum]
MLKSLCLFLGLVLVFFTVDAQTYLLGSNCTKSENYTQDPSYQYCLNNLLGTFVSQASEKGFYNSTIVQDDEQVYGLYMCRGDIIGQECDNCVVAAKNTIINSCPNQREDILWYDECMIRYAPDSILGILAEIPSAVTWNVNNVTENQNRFVQSLTIMMSGLVNETANSSSGTMYGTRALNVTESNLTVYAMQQCTPDMKKSDCRLCLTNAIQQLRFYSQGSRVLFPNCVLRYEMYPFFGPTTTATNASSPAAIVQPKNPSSAKRERHSALVPMSILVSIVSVGTCSLIGIWICKKKEDTAEPLSCKLLFIRGILGEYETRSRSIRKYFTISKKDISDRKIFEIRQNPRTKDNNADALSKYAC